MLENNNFLTILSYRRRDDDDDQHYDGYNSNAYAPDGYDHGSTDDVQVYPNDGDEDDQEAPHQQGPKR